MRRLLAPPTARLAGPLDAAALRAFRCGHGPWYVFDAAKVVRRAASVLDSAAAYRTRVLLFERNDALDAVTIVQQTESERIADLVVVAVQTDLQGTWVRQEPARPLCVAVLEETLRFARREGYERIVAMAAAQNKRSVRLITGAGFEKVTELDGDYALYQAMLPRISDHGKPLALDFQVPNFPLVPVPLEGQYLGRRGTCFAADYGGGVRAL
jgi:GNAT superfamily N-acetyltransferase